MHRLDPLRWAKKFAGSKAGKIVTRSFSPLPSRTVLGIPEVDLLDPQAHALHEPEPGTVEDPALRAWRPSLCAKTARISASVKTTGTRAGRFARSTL
jgi:hypothetical protein